jgi:hypothetical protein
MKEIKLDMDEQRENIDTQNESNVYDNETASVERIPEKIYDKVPGSTLLQKLTTISYILICAVIFVFALRTLKHINTMSDYDIPEDTVSTDESTESTEENIEYVNEVTYSPTELANELAAATNNYQDWAASINKCSRTWTFESDYEYSSAKVMCIWLCTNDDTGELLAFRVADYNGSKNEFTDPEMFITKIGEKYDAAD